MRNYKISSFLFFLFFIFLFAEKEIAADENVFVRRTVALSHLALFLL